MDLVTTSSRAAEFYATTTGSKAWHHAFRTSTRYVISACNGRAMLGVARISEELPAGETLCQRCQRGEALGSIVVAR